MEAIKGEKLSLANRKGLKDAITYFRNHQHQMNYAQARERNLPIGSGVTEAGCKVIVKGRLYGSRMQWKKVGADLVLSLRTLSYRKVEVFEPPENLDPQSKRTFNIHKLNDKIEYGHS